MNLTGNEGIEHFRTADLISLPVKLNFHDASIVARRDHVNTWNLMNVTGANSFMIPSDVTLGLFDGYSDLGPIPGSGFVIVQLGVGATSIIGASGVILNGLLAGTLVVVGQFKIACAMKIGKNNYLVSGAE